MAFDGIVVANLVRDLNDKIVSGRISKIAQPEKDELILTIKGNRENIRLLISANASLPLLYFTETNKPGPLTAPNFCMLLRKHISGGRIVSVTQPGLERVVRIEVEHLDEMGDLRRKFLIVELMGKHSNIIFCDDRNLILDSIKHISAQVSSVREVLPGREYFIPHAGEKKDPLTITEEAFKELIKGTPQILSKALYLDLTGLSPVAAAQICHLASLDGDISAKELSDAELTHLYHAFSWVMDDVRQGKFTPNIVYQKEKPAEFASIPLTMYEGGDYRSVSFPSISALLEQYYAEKNAVSRIHQKSTDLRKILSNSLERSYKKRDLQQKQLKDTEKREKYRIYGELLNTYGYNIPEGEKSFSCTNYYDNTEVTIPLDPTLSARENAVRYFEKYNKQKRTFEATTDQLMQTQAEIEHLESISTFLDIARKEEDLAQIKEELTEYGYIKRHFSGGKKQKKIISRPFHYLSSDGFHIYVGKNNYQNEELTFKLASGNDWWFHAKGIPGSHVIVKSEGRELPDRVFEEAGALAAYYSKGRNQDKVEIDYIQRKNLKKVPGAAPGFVVYHTNYSLVASPGIPVGELE
ncbi:MAG TPA: NFACT family protein [Candidatus Copromonas faecavium]|uniref:Rqc2 homolog RqcH n=1 Tax=Candidatus Copromonas faecavium (nom. illeg.) TaxID=2840740 RepID=A0A9D1A476_9FIRM|nr:NFACT family protein [Candidatus Copromonas faecavium]